MNIFLSIWIVINLWHSAFQLKLNHIKILDSYDTSFCYSSVAIYIKGPFNKVLSK